MVYFAIVGGAAALETTQIEEIEEVAWEELMPECLWKFRVKDFGPLTVGDRRPRDVALPRRPGGGEEAIGGLCMPGFNGFLDLPARPPKPRTAGAHARHRQGPRAARRSRASSTRPATTSTSSSSAGARATSPSNLEEEDRALPLVRGPRRLRRHALRGRRRAREARRVPALAGGERLLPRRGLRRHDRPAARAEARAHRRARPGLRRHVRGRLEGLRGRLRPLPVGAVAEGGPRGRRLEGDHRGPRGRHRRASSARPATCAPA